MANKTLKSFEVQPDKLAGRFNTNLSDLLKSDEINSQVPVVATTYTPLSGVESKDPLFAQHNYFGNTRINRFVAQNSLQGVGLALYVPNLGIINSSEPKYLLRPEELSNSKLKLLFPDSQNMLWVGGQIAKEGYIAVNDHNGVHVVFVEERPHLPFERKLLHVLSFGRDAVINHFKDASQGGHLPREYSMGRHYVDLLIDGKPLVAPPITVPVAKIEPVASPAPQPSPDITIYPADAPDYVMTPARLREEQNKTKALHSGGAFSAPTHITPVTPPREYPHPSDAEPARYNAPLNLNRPSWQQRKEERSQPSAFEKWLEANKEEPKPVKPKPKAIFVPRPASSPEFAEFEIDNHNSRMNGFGAKYISALEKAAGFKVNLEGIPEQIPFMISTVSLGVNADQRFSDGDESWKNSVVPKFAVDYGGNILVTPSIPGQYKDETFQIITQGYALRASNIYSRIKNPLEQGFQNIMEGKLSLPDNMYREVLAKFAREISMHHPNTGSLRHPAVDAWLWIDQKMAATSYFVFNDGNNGRLIYDKFFSQERKLPKRSMLHVISLGKDSAVSHFDEVDNGGWRPSSDETGLLFYDELMARFEARNKNKEEPPKSVPVEIKSTPATPGARSIAQTTSVSSVRKPAAPYVSYAGVENDDDEAEPEEVDKNYFGSPAREYENTQESIEEFMGGLEIAVCLNWGNPEITNVLERRQRDDLRAILNKQPDIDEDITVKSIFTGENFNAREYVDDVEKRRFEFTGNTSLYNTPPMKYGITFTEWKKQVNQLRDLELAQVKENGHPEIFKELHPVLPQKDLDQILAEIPTPKPWEISSLQRSGTIKSVYPTVPSSLGGRWKVVWQYAQNLRRTTNDESFTNAREMTTDFADGVSEFNLEMPLDLLEPAYIWNPDDFHAPPWHEEYPSDEEVDVANASHDEQIDGTIIDDHGLDIAESEMTEVVGPYDHVDEEDETYTLEQLGYQSRRRWRMGGW